MQPTLLFRRVRRPTLRQTVIHRDKLSRQPTSPDKVDIINSKEKIYNTFPVHQSDYLAFLVFRPFTSPSNTTCLYEKSTFLTPLAPLKLILVAPNPPMHMLLIQSISTSTLKMGNLHTA
jgi:hypothetical protein